MQHSVMSWEMYCMTSTQLSLQIIKYYQLPPVHGSRKWGGGGGGGS